MSQAPSRGGEGSSEGKPKRQRMRWAQLLKRVFKVDVESCGSCGGKLKVMLSGDALFVISLFILGGEFWDRLKKLFQWKAESSMPV